jgi:hypothetical protein
MFGIAVLVRGIVVGSAADLIGGSWLVIRLGSSSEEEDNA